MTHHRKPRLRIPAETVKQLKAKLKKAFREGRGRNIKGLIIEELNPELRGWGNYFQLSETKKALEELDAWIRRRLRGVLWRQWRRPYTRAKELRKRGIKEERAYRSAYNGRGPWWNSGASHLNEALPKSYFDLLGLESLLNRVRRLRLVTRTAVYGTVRTVV